MKKFVIFIFPVVLVIVGVSCCSFNLNNIFGNNRQSQGTLCFADFGFVGEMGDSLEYKKYIKNSNVVGECIELKNQPTNLNRICEDLGLLIINKYNVGEINIIEGCSNLLPYRIKERQCNIQIAVSDEKIVIGSPIIYGSY